MRPVQMWRDPGATGSLESAHSKASECEHIVPERSDIDKRFDELQAILAECRDSVERQRLLIEQIREVRRV